MTVKASINGIAELDFPTGVPSVSVSGEVATINIDNTLAADDDVLIASPANGQVLTYDTATGKWKNQNATASNTAKDPSRVATASALPTYSYVSGVITASANGALTVDGIAVSVSNRILLINGAAASDNGIYTVTQAGDVTHPFILTRASDCDSSSNYVSGAYTVIEQGTANSGKVYVVSTQGTITVGTTSVTWVSSSGGGSSITLETNGTPNGSQTLLNLASGSGMTLTDNGSGTVTIANQNVGIAGVVIGSGITVPATGSKGFLQVPYSATILSWTIIADQIGSAQVTVKKCTTGAFPTTVSIVGAAPPVLVSQQLNTNATLTGWTTTITAGDILEFNLDSISGINRLVLELKLQRS